MDKPIHHGDTGSLQLSETSNRFHSLQVAAFDLIVDGSSACLRSCTTFLRPPEAVDYVMDALSDAAAIRLGNFRRRLQAVFLQRQEPMSIDIFFQTSRFALSCKHRVALSRHEKMQS